MKKQQSKKLNLQKIRIANLNATTDKKAAPTTTVLLSIRNLC